MLEMDPCTIRDKGSYKLTVKNEKGEATSTNIEVTEIPEEDAPKAPTISRKLKSVVRMMCIDLFFAKISLICANDSFL